MTGRALLSSLCALAAKAGALVMDHYQARTPGRDKADRSPVTDADEQAEHLILAGLEALAPGVPVISEEAAAAGAGWGDDRGGRCPRCGFEHSQGEPCCPSARVRVGVGDIAGEGCRIAGCALHETRDAEVQSLTNWEMASRLSFFLWASIPDEELRRAANAGELTDTAGIQRQVKRMLADAKARRLSTEFFGQWLGFYHFDQHKGVDTTRFSEFTDDVKAAMYDEAVSFFEHVIRTNRPVRELLSADYTFLNKNLATFYGVKKEVNATQQPELVTGTGAFHRGGGARIGVKRIAPAMRTQPIVPAHARGQFRVLHRHDRSTAFASRQCNE